MLAATSTHQRIGATLFRSHNNWLISWLRRQRNTVHSPEDIASEVFLRLLALPKLDEVREPRAMMSTIARRVLYDLRRRNDLWKTYEADLIAAPAGAAESPEDRLIVVEALRAVDRMLEMLSPKARAAFLYSRLDGMKHQEIATKLGVSVKSVENYIAQGLVRAYALRKELL